MLCLHISYHYYNPADQFLALPKIRPMCSNAGDRRRPQGLFLSYSLLLARITQLAHHHITTTIIITTNIIIITNTNLLQKNLKGGGKLKLNRLQSV